MLRRISHLFAEHPALIALVTLVSYWIIGWLGTFATAQILIDGTPLKTAEIKDGRVHLIPGLADYRGLSFVSPAGELIRHSGYQLVASKIFPSILNRDVVSLYDATFMPESAVSPDGHRIQRLVAKNIAFYRLALGDPAYITRDPQKFGAVAIKFDHTLGCLFLNLLRYRALLIAIVFVLALLNALPRISKTQSKIISAGIFCYLTTWAVAFHPGLFTFDSIHQLTNAATLNFDTMHPPIMALIAAAAMRSIGTPALILVQAAIGLLGIILLIKNLAKEHPHSATITILVLALLLSPLFPFTPYLFTFWKDAWTAFVVVWIMVLILKDTAPHFASKTTTLALLIALLLFTLLRHNAIVMIPLWFGVILWWFTKHLSFSRSRSFLLSLGITAGLCIAPSAVNYLAKAKKVFGSNQIYLLELLGAQQINPEIAKIAPFLNSHIIDPDWQAHFDLDRNDQLFGWGTPAIVSSQIGTFDADIPEIRGEYINAWYSWPRTMLQIKLTIFWKFLLAPRAPYANGITDNNLGLQFNPKFQATREVLFWLTERVWNSSARILCAPLFNILAFLVLVAVRCPRLNRPQTLCLSIIWGALYLIYAFACPAAEYRYLFPGILLGTIASLTSLATRVSERAERTTQPSEKSP